MHSIDALLGKADEYLVGGEKEMLRAALRIAERKHWGVERQDGSQYFLHSVGVGLILTEWKAPAEILAAGLLHDVLKKHYSVEPDLSGIEDAFPERVVELIREVNSIDIPNFKISPASEVTYRSLWTTAMLRKSPEAMVIKIADRIHNLNTLNDLENKVDFARNVLHTFASVAYRLGMGRVMRQLQDGSFRVIDPDAYENADRLYQEAYGNAGLNHLLELLEQNIARESLDAKVLHFVTHRYGIHRRTLERKGVAPAPTDLLFVNLLTRSKEDIYQALRVVHESFEPLDEVRDFIARPKPNGYRALHTRVLNPSLGTFQIAIMTSDMYTVAEYGVTAAWQGIGPEMLPRIERLETEPEEIIVLTPQGDVKNLPLNSTPVDFAYSLHPQIGHRCFNSLVNGAWTPLNAQLKSGDVVDIIVQRGVTSGPDADWLNFVVTDQAKKEIAGWTRRKSKVEFQIEAHDRSGLVLEVSSVFSQKGYSIKSFRAESFDDGKAEICVMLVGVETSEVADIIEQIKTIPFVFNVGHREYRTSVPRGAAGEHAGDGAARETYSKSFRGNPWSTQQLAVEHFKGRQDDTHQIVSSLRGPKKNNTLLVWGQRRIGKTSLLVRLRDHILPAQKCIPIYVNLQFKPNTPIAYLLHDITKQIADSVKHEKVNSPSMNKMKREPVAYFQTFIEQVGRFAGPQNLLIMLDEFEGIDRLEEEGATREDVYHGFRSLIQHNVSVSFLFSAGVTLRKLRQRPGLRSLFSVVDHVRLECLESEDARALITEPAPFIDFTEAAISRLLQVTGCHPCYIQHLCRIIYEKAATQKMHVGEQDVEEVIKQSLHWRSIATLESLVEHFWSLDTGGSPRADMANRVVLSCVAGAPGGLIDYDSLARSLHGALGEAEVVESLNEMIEYGSVVKDGADYRISIPLLEIFFREKYPLNQVIHTVK